MKNNKDLILIQTHVNVLTRFEKYLSSMSSKEEVEKQANNFIVKMNKRMIEIKEKVLKEK